MYRDSGGRVTDFEKAAMERTGRVDVALVAVSASYLNTVTVQQALEHVRTYRPDVYIPAHHDAAYNNLWRATEPLFQAVKDDNPNIVTVSKGYREPICFNTEHNVSRAVEGLEPPSATFSWARARLNVFAKGRRPTAPP